MDRGDDKDKKWDRQTDRGDDKDRKWDRQTPHTNLTRTRDNNSQNAVLRNILRERISYFQAATIALVRQQNKAKTGEGGGVERGKKDAHVSCAI